MFFPPLAFVAKKELLSIPFFGWGFALASPITIDRKAGTRRDGADRRRRAASASRRASGSSSTRKARGSAPARARKYKTGGARLAIELGVPILPVAHNAGCLWPKGVFGKRAGHDHDVDRQADRARRARTRSALTQRGRDVDRGRGRAAGRAA